MKKSTSIGKSIKLSLLIIIGLVVYAYGFEVTQVNLNEIQSPTRQTSLIRVLRAMARPDIIRYDQEVFTVNEPILVPCPQAPFDLPDDEPEPGVPYMLLTPPCAGPREEILVEGFNFEPNTRGPISFIPPSEVTLQLGQVETDGEGHFITTVRLPPRPSDEVQFIRTVTRRNVGAPYLSRSAIDTWGKIVETVFLALLATTLGTILAVPISFFAARNLMKDITNPLSALALAILGWVAGMGIGGAFAAWVGDFSQRLVSNPLMSLAGLAISALGALATVRWTVPQDETRQMNAAPQVVRWLALIIAGLAVVLALFLLAHLASLSGRSLAPRLGSFGFLGSFLSDLGEILNLIIASMGALAGGTLVSSAAGQFGKKAFLRVPASTRLILNIILGAMAGALLAALVGAGIGWLYQISSPARTLYLPAAIGAGAGVLTALRTRQAEFLPVGLVVYYITRTILNATRAIEPLIMAIVFVVWVGIGPFAGVLALSLHTIASLAKLYSEQVESILPGPLEAVKSTGATRLQTIVYAVIPQIIPPYISFTMYRWDINVRMSTIIGFAGGGGIGFLLQQNINLLNYRAASVQMLAIAIVVGIMDFVSSSMRERVV